jgi:hypothetical protein
MKSIGVCFVSYGTPFPHFVARRLLRSALSIRLFFGKVKWVALSFYALHINVTGKSVTLST